MHFSLCKLREGKVKKEAELKISGVSRDFFSGLRCSARQKSLRLTGLIDSATNLNERHN